MEKWPRDVYRCNRLLITAKHETNAGGACDARDAAGEKERYNIRILMEKWPGAIKNHPTRANQVVMRWDWREEDAEGGKRKREPEAAKESQEATKAAKAKKVE